MANEAVAECCEITHFANLLDIDLGDATPINDVVESIYGAASA